MDARLGLCTAGILNRLRTFTWVLVVPYLASNGKTISQTLRSWTVQSVPALKPYSSRPSCGWDTLSGWTTIACPISCCTGSLRLARESKAVCANDTRTLRRGTVNGAAFSWKNLRPQLVTSYWCSLTYTASASFKDGHCQRLRAAYEHHHRASSADIKITEFQCCTCSRLCASRLGLESHLRIHRWSHTTQSFSNSKDNHYCCHHHDQDHDLHLDCFSLYHWNYFDYKSTLDIL